MLAVFTKEVAEALIAGGFTLLDRSNKAWFFEDTGRARAVIEEITKNL